MKVSLNLVAAAALGLGIAACGSGGPSAACRAELASYKKYDQPVTVNMGSYGYQTIPRNALMASFEATTMKQQKCPDAPRG